MFGYIVRRNFCLNDPALINQSALSIRESRWNGKRVEYCLWNRSVFVTLLQHALNSLSAVSRNSLAAGLTAASLAKNRRFVTASKGLLIS